MVKAWPILVLAVLWAGTAEAHKLKIFATRSGERIEGMVYFVNGGGVPDLPLRVEAADGTRLPDVRSDAEGNFSLAVPKPGPHVIIAGTDDGHEARFSVAASGKTASPEAVSRPKESEIHAQLPAEELERLMASQLRPLKEQINRLEDQLRIQDLLGGVGYIFGLAGLGLWLGRRKEKSSP